MTTQMRTKTLTAPKGADALPDLPTQRVVADTGTFRLQVDRQTKASYATFEAARAAGLLIKQAHPIVQVAVYDATEGSNKIIELPATGEP